MCTAPLLLMCNLLLAPPQPQVEPAIRIGIWYAGPGAQPPATAAADLEAVRADLEVIRRAGFNAITTWIAWREAEPRRGAYALAALERLIAAAAQNDLRVDVLLFVDTPPAWSTAATTEDRVAADRVAADRVAADRVAADRVAADRVAADRARFVEYARSRLRLGAAVTSVEAAESSGDLDTAIRVGRNARTPIQARMDFWAAIARGTRRIALLDAAGGAGPSVLSLGETIGIVTRNQALFSPLRPREGGIRNVVGGSGAPVEVKLLESADALVIVGINYSPSVQKVTINFAPEIPGAIWQNLETTTSVNFVMGRGGPFLEHTFSPRDTLVLMIRKTLR